MKKIGDYLEIHELCASTAMDPSDERSDRAVIRCRLRAETPVKVLYMASLELDGMELVESFRLVVEPGMSECALPEIFVFNPIRSADEQCGWYQVALKIYASGGIVHEFFTQVRFGL